jgi:hypothetical protein
VTVVTSKIFSTTLVPSTIEAEVRMRHVWFFALAITVGSVSVARAQPDEPRPTPQPPPVAQPLPPPGYYSPPPAYPPGYVAPPPIYTPRFRNVEVEQRRWNLFVPGAILFGAMWFTTGAIGYAGGQGYMLIPLVGPLFYLNGANDAGARLGNVLLVASTLAQAAGVTMAILGLALTRKVIIREPITLAPYASPTSTGLALSGRF